MEVSAKLRRVRLSPRKARLVADQIRGRMVGEALDILSFSNKKAGDILERLLKSAIANAEHNLNADPDNLRIATVCVDQGPVLKRMKPRARGRADRLLKPTSHIVLSLTDGAD